MSSYTFPPQHSLSVCKNCHPGDLDPSLLCILFFTCIFLTLPAELNASTIESTISSLWLITVSSYPYIVLLLAVYMLCISLFIPDLPYKCTLLSRMSVPTLISTLALYCCIIDYNCCIIDYHVLSYLYIGIEMNTIHLPLTQYGDKVTILKCKGA